MLTINLDNIAFMPCNPSVGGPAKGIVVREIDALGGQMAKTIDKTHIQMRMLNTGKGPAVRALRAQADKVLYQQEMKKVIEDEDNLDIMQGMVDDLMIEDDVIKGVRTNIGTEYWAEAVIITTGTFLRGEIILGNMKYSSGPNHQLPSISLADNLRGLGFDVVRFKTGTPPRVNAKTAMYSSMIKGTGPRYCPSIEDKFVRFNDKPRHQLFLEPEGRNTNEVYVQGLSTSLPEHVQRQMLETIPGLEKADMMRAGYAIGYDALVPTQLWPTLETKKIKNLYTAGQINGTSGYEEAAGQGIMAGINAAARVQGKEEVILSRSDAYIGVLIDDLITKGTNEPYRLLTSRAEYRLLLRHDNADLRLTDLGYELGMVSEERYARFNEKREMIKAEQERLQGIRVKPNERVQAIIEGQGGSRLKDGILALELLRRPEMTYDLILEILDETHQLPSDVEEQVEIQTKYEGYINKSLQQVEKVKRMEEKKIPEDLDYSKVDSLATEAREKLAEVKPLNIAQASRISGVNPADISILLVFLEQGKIQRVNN